MARRNPNPPALATPQALGSAGGDTRSYPAHFSSRIRCAVYTRKSSEEGLEQSFNSLHAQREACEAFILSQRHEGWIVLPTAYDDGGFSGGSMERPALRQLIADLQAGLVDVVVVYKIDRLTRSLFDFARIVEVLDAAKASFVSVTQSFNTTTSMGRLTLNVLLSFAQFEREVTGERIRDKIAASRARGMFMGGNVPLGYNLQDHELVPNEKEAKLVRFIFDRWLRHGSMKRLKQELDQRGATTKRREKSGGQLFGMGHLRWILTNPVYVGLARHKGKVHPGRHPAIIDQAIWDAVQARFAANRQTRRTGADGRLTGLLAGRIVDSQGWGYASTHSGSRGRRFRYYLAPEQPGDAEASPIARRLPAAQVEGIVLKAIIDLLADPHRLLDALRPQRNDERPADRHAPIHSSRDTTVSIELALGGAGLAARELELQGWRPHIAFLRGVIARLIVREDRFDLVLDRHSLRRELGLKPECVTTNDHGDSSKSPQATSHTRSTEPDEPASTLLLTIPVSPPRRHRHGRLVLKASQQPSARQPDPVLVEAIDRARRWYLKLFHDPSASIASIATAEGKNRGWVSSQMTLAFIPPDVEEAIRAGAQPEGMTVKELFGVAQAREWEP